VKTLDYRRLGKQRVEAYQIWKILKKLPNKNGSVSTAWRNHPAVKMWEGYTCFLAKYCNACIDEWVTRGYKNTMEKLPHCVNPRPPWWWGHEDVIMSHQASLNRKNPSFYHFEVSQDKYPDYVWPTRLITSQ
jgi:hypothetical protein